MIRKLLSTTTAIVLVLTLTPPGIAPAQTAEGQWMLAASEGNGKAKKKREEEVKKKSGEAEATQQEVQQETQQEAQQEAQETGTETTTETTGATDAATTEQVQPAASTESTQPAQDQQPATQTTEQATEQTAGQATEPAQSTETQVQQTTDQAQQTETQATEQQPAQPADQQTGQQTDEQTGQQADQQTGQQSGVETQATQSDQGESAQQGAPAAEQQPAQQATSEATAAQPSAEQRATTGETKTKEQTREERRAARKQQREERKARRERPAAAAALQQEQTTGTAATETSSGASATGETATSAPVEVTSETVTEETTRSSSEDTVEARPDRKKKKDKDDDLAKIIGAGAGGLAAGVIIGTLLNDGGEVVENTGDRLVIERDGQYFVRKDENQILRRPGSDVRTETFSDGSSRTIVERADGTRVVTIRDADGYVVHRSRELPDGRTVLLFDDLNSYGDSYGRESAMLEVDTIPPFDPSLAQNHHVDYGNASRGTLREVLEARPAVRLDRPYTLRQVREIAELRQLMPSLDLDVITFDSGSAAIRPDQARKLDDLGFALEDMIAQNPDEVFLIEGHTDAVGSRIFNLALSDRRAESVALALTEYYDIPPENLFTQGYGEEYLKVLTEAPERANRRATVRRITPLLDRTAARQ